MGPTQRNHYHHQQIPNPFPLRVCCFDLVPEHFPTQIQHQKTTNLSYLRSPNSNLLHKADPNPLPSCRIQDSSSAGSPPSHLLRIPSLSTSSLTRLFHLLASTWNCEKYSSIFLFPLRPSLHWGRHHPLWLLPPRHTIRSLHTDFIQWAVESIPEKKYSIFRVTSRSVATSK